MSPVTPNWHHNNSRVSVRTAYCSITWCMKIFVLNAGQPTVLPPRALCHRPCISTTHTGKHALLCRVRLRIHHEWPSGYLWQCYRQWRICYSPKYHGCGNESLPVGESHNETGIRHESNFVVIMAAQVVVLTPMTTKIWHREWVYPIKYSRGCVLPCFVVHILSW